MVDMYRQGDILLIRVTKPTGARRTLKTPRIVVAEGEATGHAHVLEAERIVEFTDEQIDRRFLQLVGEGQLVHDEHATVTLPEGIYEVRRQREFSPDAIRNIAD